MIVSQSPQLLGLGVDEDTAADRRARTTCCSVVGRGAVTILDPAQHHHQRLRGQALRAAAGQRRRAARAAAGRPLRPHHPHAAARSTTHVDPLEAAEIAEAGHDLRQMARDIAAGDASPSVLRRRLRRSDATDRLRDPTGRRRTHDRTAHPRPHDPRDPGLPRRQHLVLRHGDPPRGRPRLAGEVPDQHDPRLHRQPARDAPRAARALLLPRQARRLRRAAQRGHLAGPRRRARRAGPPAGGRPRHPPRQDPRGQGPARPLQRDLRVRRRAGRARRRASSPYAWSTTSSRPTRSSTGTQELEAFILRAERTAFGPSTQAILDEAVSRDIPWIRLNQYSLVQLGQGVHAKRIRATMTSATSAIAVDIASDKDLTTRLLGAAGLPVPKQDDGAHRGPGRAGGGADRLPGRASSRSTATTAAGSASTCRTRTTCGRRSRSPRSSPGAA